MLKLSSTSALVLLWAQGCYKTKMAKDFLKQLDLSEGETLYKNCDEVWPHYAEVIKNRKFGVFNLIKKACNKENNCKQIIIAGAGLDALGIEITENYPHVKVFEIDNENIILKSNLYLNLDKNPKANISFIENNLLDFSSVYKNLIAKKWNPN